MWGVEGRGEGGEGGGQRIVLLNIYPHVSAVCVCVCVFVMCMCARAQKVWWKICAFGPLRSSFAGISAEALSPCNEEVWLHMPDMQEGRVVAEGAAKVTLCYPKPPAPGDFGSSIHVR